MHHLFVFLCEDKHKNFARTELEAWVLTFKHLGPPTELLYPGTKALEMISDPSQLAERGTSTLARQKHRLGRAAYREDRAQKNYEAIKRARYVSCNCDT